MNMRPHRSEPIDVFVRPGVGRDLPAIESIEREAATMFCADDLPPALAQPMQHAELAAAIARSLLWVAQEPRFGAIGFIACRTSAASLHIAEMDVRPRYGRRGAGQALLSYACAAAKVRGLRFLTLTTFAHLPWNAPFYARHGFEVATEVTAFPHLAAALLREHDRGLRHRVAMVKRLTWHPSANDTFTT